MSEFNQTYHIPVLLPESISALDINSKGIYVDVTFGGGGHSKEILKHLDKEGHLFGFDQDADAERNIIDDSRFTFVRSNFRYLKNFLRYHNIPKVDGILADLGVSSHHFDAEERGFSFRFNSKLDMRMNTRASLSAVEVINNYEENRLADIFYLYGELKNSRRLASTIVKARESKKIETVEQLIQLITPLFRKGKENKEFAKVFQAIRIEVNKEMDALRDFLESAKEMLKPEGRLVVITYHSLEDRMVKNFIRSGNIEGKVETDFFGNRLTPFEAVNNRVITPTDLELERNSRSRSAKLRIAKKKENGSGKA